jgi:hypothetical protein
MTGDWTILGITIYSGRHDLVKHYEMNVSQVTTGMLCLS